MTGLEKMKSQILDEANTLAEGKIDEAKKAKEEVLSIAMEEAQAEAAAILQKSEKEVANYKERVLSSIDLQKRTRILEVKQEVIEKVIDQAYEKMNEMEEGEYFQVLLKMIEKYANGKEGIIYFSRRDLDRMPAEYEAKIQKAAEKNGGTLTLSSEAKAIENGFVLVYEGIEENCTWKTMFDARRDELADLIHRVIFQNIEVETGKGQTV